MVDNKNKPFPPPKSLRKMIGPSFVILALGLGSGEVILWPYLVSNYGLGIAWGAVLGITFQFFMNMEIERYALVKGESVFVGVSKIFSWATYWFIISTFIGFGLPGIIAASAKIFAYVFGITNFKWIAILFLLSIGIILSLGKTVYGMLEKFTKTIILFGVPFIFVLAIILSSKADWWALLNGLRGNGDGYTFFPAGISLAAFLAAFAYSGAGGNLNLTQSIYIKEKGYGMGEYSQKIAGLFMSKGKPTKIKLTGENFEATEENIFRFKIWWRKINAEHLLVFWLVGSITMLLLMLLAYTATAGTTGNAEGINFVLNEGKAIGLKLFPLAGSIFLFVASIMLFQTQLGIMDSCSRIMAENVAIQKTKLDPDKDVNLTKIYYIFVWAQIFFGIILFLFNIYEPKSLILLGAVINAVAMFVHIGLVNVTNHKLLAPVFRPTWRRKVAMLFIFIFFGFFSGITIWSQFF